MACGLLDNAYLSVGFMQTRWTECRPTVSIVLSGNRAENTQWLAPDNPDGGFAFSSLPPTTITIAVIVQHRREHRRPSRVFNASITRYCRRRWIYFRLRPAKILLRSAAFCSCTFFRGFSRWQPPIRPWYRLGHKRILSRRYTVFFYFSVPSSRGSLFTIIFPFPILPCNTQHVVCSYIGGPQTFPFAKPLICWKKWIYCVTKIAWCQS